MNLYQLGDCTLSSGRKSFYRINCEVLTAADWDTLAEEAVRVVGPFSEVHGVPRGGLPFQEALERLCKRRPFLLSFMPFPRLIVDDVWTTGNSVKRFYDTLPPGHRVKVVVVYARGAIADSSSDWLAPDGSPRPYPVRALRMLPRELWVKNG